MTVPIEDLAIFGGNPAFESELHVGRPNLGDRARLLERFESMLDRLWLTNAGPMVREFEERIESLLGVRHCVAMCNGTIALEIAIRGVGLSGEVILPAFTFVATAHALRWQGITPVFCDIDPTTCTIDPARIEELITPHTTGIIGVHLWSRPCEIEALEEIAARHGLKLIFDAAHAFACTHAGRALGSFGDAEVFSFHATKFLNAFEGGAVTTNDPDLAAQIRLMKNFGFAGYDNVIHLGTNGKMSEVSAAMGLTSLESIDDFIEVNRRNHLAYRRELQSIPGLKLLPYSEEDRTNYQYVIVFVDEATTGIGRDALVQVLHAENVIARKYFHPGCHRMEPYRSEQPWVGPRLPYTESAAKQVVALPTGTAISEKEIALVGTVLRSVIANGAEIDARMRGQTAS